MADRVGLRKHALAYFRPRVKSLGSPRCTRRPKRLAAFCRTWVRIPHPIRHQQINPRMGAYLLMADRVGFEPTRRFPVHTLSKRAPSATRPPVLTKRRDYSVSSF